MENNVNKDTYINIITSIVGVAASQVDGVASVSNEAGSMMNKINVKNRSKCIDVEIVGDNQVVISLSVNAYFGYRVPALTCDLQEKIQSEVEKATSYKVKAVNVNIVGVVFPV